MTITSLFYPQVTGIQFPFLDGNLSTPLLKTVYLGHPAAKKFDGENLAADILTLLRSYEFTNDELAKMLCGGVFDGQYLHLRVIDHIGKKNVFNQYFITHLIS